MGLIVRDVHCPRVPVGSLMGWWFYCYMYVKFSMS